MLSALQLLSFKQKLKLQSAQRQPKYGIKRHNVLHMTQLVESEREYGEISKKTEAEEVEVFQAQDGYLERASVLT